MAIQSIVPAEDALVLATVNAPYRRQIDHDMLASCLAGERQDWIVHVATFFTDVRPALVLGFARRNGVPLDRLASTYRRVRDKTGERNRCLEDALGDVEAVSGSRF